MKNQSSTPVGPDFQALHQRAASVFRPSVPIEKDSLFAGRLPQVTQIVDAINNPGQHAILFGERGVGKTSLANVLGEKWKGFDHINVVRISCLSTDSSDDLWRRSLREFEIGPKPAMVGLRLHPATPVEEVAPGLPAVFDLDDVRAMLTAIGRQSVLVLIFDEFDQLSAECRKAIAEAIKQFADYTVPVTLVLVGVADSVGGLLRDHLSVERALVQVQMPRMSDEEIAEILKTGATALGMTFAEDATARVTYISRGLPHYAHLLGLYATRAALGRHDLRVTEADVTQAIEGALDNCPQSLKEAYALATTSSHKNNLYKEVLLACALAETDLSGFFTASDVSGPLSRIMAKQYDVPAYARHLREFTDVSRGPILEITGRPRHFKYRFRNPLMQPYVVLQGYRSGMAIVA